MNLLHVSLICIQRKCITAQFYQANKSKGINGNIEPHFTKF